MQMDEANFDPEQDLRDYAKVAESLPVFCVSSRVYQRLLGRMKKDKINRNGYTCPEDTEVPQLQQHAKQLTEAGRAMTSRIFLYIRPIHEHVAISPANICVGMTWRLYLALCRGGPRELSLPPTIHSMRN